jgi:hypothetical protein
LRGGAAATTDASDVVGKLNGNGINVVVSRKQICFATNQA